MQKRLFIINAKLGKLQRTLEDPDKLLHGVGNLLVQSSRNAFIQQRFGDAPWLTVLPNSSSPFINWPQAITDLEHSATVRERWFKKKPALWDRGTLRNSIKVTGIVQSGHHGSVTVSATDSKAGLHQGGGSNTINVTTTARSNYLGALGIQEDRYKKFKWNKKTRDTIEARAPGLLKLGAMLFPGGSNNPSELPAYNVQVANRPFVGVTEDTYLEIMGKIAKYLS